MKITANRAALADAVTWVAQATAKNPSSPALAGVRLATVGSAVQITGFNFDVAHVANLVDVEVADGEALVSGTFLRSVLGGLRTKQVTLELDGNTLTIAGGGSTYRTQVISLADYPTLPASPEVVGTVDADSLRAAIAAVKAPVDDGAPTEQVRGLRIEADAQRLVLIGSDGRRINRAVLPWTGKPFAATVPVSSIEGAVKGLTGAVQVGQVDGVIGLADVDRSVTLRTYAEGYMALDKVEKFLAPVADGPSAVVDTAELRDAVRRVMTLAEDGGTIAVTLGVHLSLETATEGSDGAERIEYLECDHPVVIRAGFNPRYLADALAAIPTPLVELRPPAERGPWLVLPVDDTSDPDLTLAVLTKKLER